MVDATSRLRRFRGGVGLLAGGLIAGALVGAPPTNVDQPAARPADADPGSATARSNKPYAPGSVQIDASELTAGGDTIRVLSTPQAGFSAASVTTSSVGPDVNVVGDLAKPVPPSAAVSTFRVDVSNDPSTAGAAGLRAEATSSVGISTVSATLKANDTSGTARSISDQVWVTDFDGTTLISETGEQDLRLQKVARLTERGATDALTAAAMRQGILGATDSSVHEAQARAACVGVCASGTIRWTDSAGDTHPVPFAPVELRDGPTVVGTTTTALDGTYAVSADPAGPRDISVRVLAAGEDFDVGGQFIESPVTPAVVSGTELTIDLTANNTADNNTAFSLQNAMYLGTKYLDTRVDGGLRFLDVVYPDPDGSYYDGDELHVLALDRFDWDVMLHEYGHFVAGELDIENNPGGPHSSEDNLSDFLGKEVGVPLAFGEGWPTYFAVSLLQIQNAADLGVPNAGDSKYQDTEDQEVTDDLEEGGTLGEDNEFTVMSVLWDLYDTPEDGLDKVALGDEVVWDRLVAGGTDDPGTLSDAYRLLALGGAGTADPVSCVFSGLNVAPLLAEPTVTSVGKDDAIPTFSWDPGNGGDYQNDSFVVELRDAGGNTLLAASSPRDSTSYTPPSEPWLSALRRSEGTLRIAVVGTQSSEPVTGPYRSCMADIGVLPLADAGGPYRGTATEAVALDASASVAPGSTIAGYEWDFEADGTYDLTTATPTTTHVYEAPFDGKVKVRITAAEPPSADSQLAYESGATDVAEAPITVVAAPKPPPSTSTPPPPSTVAPPRPPAPPSTITPPRSIPPVPVTAPKPAAVTPLRLVRTGINSGALLLAAGGLVLGGIAIEVLRRRRRS